MTDEQSLSLSLVEQEEEEEFREQAANIELQSELEDAEDPFHENPNDCDWFEITNGLC